MVDLKPGQLVRFKPDADFPIFNYSLDIGGLTGLVKKNDTDPDVVVIELAKHFDDLDEWDNCLEFYGFDSGIDTLIAILESPRVAKIDETNIIEQ